MTLLSQFTFLGFISLLKIGGLDLVISSTYSRLSTLRYSQRKGDVQGWKDEEGGGKNDWHKSPSPSAGHAVLLVRRATPGAFSRALTPLPL